METLRYELAELSLAVIRSIRSYDL